MYRKRAPVSTFFSDAHGCSVVWNDDICPSVRWALIIVRTCSGHKRPGIAEWRLSLHKTTLASLRPCDFWRDTKQGEQPDLGFGFLDEHPGNHICRLQDKHQDWKKYYMRVYMNSRRRNTKSERERKVLAHFMWYVLEFVGYVTKLKFLPWLRLGWDLESQSVLPTKKNIWEASVHEAGHRANGAALVQQSKCQPCSFRLYSIL